MQRLRGGCVEVGHIPTVGGDAEEAVVAGGTRLSGRYPGTG
jgi:hypothetical protein